MTMSLSPIGTMSDRVSAFAEHLCSVGIAGKRVILLCQNSVDFAISLYGNAAALDYVVPLSASAKNRAANDSRLCPLVSGMTAMTNNS